MLESSTTCREKHHENEPLDYYCQKCEVCICNKCGQTRHTKHTKVDIEQAAAEQKIKMEDVLQEMKEKITKHEKEMAMMTELLKKNRKKIAAARNSVLTTVEELIRVLKKHEIAMVTKLDILEEREQRDHAIQLEHLQISVTKLESSVKYCEAIIQRNISVEILETQQTTIKRCKGLLKATEMNIYKPLYVCYKTQEKEVEKVRCAVPGRVIVSTTDPQRSQVVEFYGEAGQNSYLRITTNNSEGKRCYSEIDQIFVKIQSPSGKEFETAGKIEHYRDGQYTAFFTPDCGGKHKVMIGVNGQQLFWKVDVQAHEYCYLGSFASRGKGRGQFKDPCNIAVNNKTGKIAVADRKNERVQLFSPDRSYLTEFGQKGPGAKKLTDPTSVAFTKSNNVIIIASGAINCFAESGQFINTITNEQVKNPFHLTIDCDGRLVVSDWGDKSIKVLSPDGAELLQTLSAPDCDESPWIAVYHQDMFYVSYPSARCVKVFNNEGEFLYDIGSENSGDGELRKPLGLAVDKFNNLIVCDGDNSNPKIFTLKGKFVNTVRGQSLFGENWLECPSSIDVSATGVLFIADTSKNFVQMFK